MASSLFQNSLAAENSTAPLQLPSNHIMGLTMGAMLIGVLIATMLYGGQDQTLSISSTLHGSSHLSCTSINRPNVYLLLHQVPGDPS
ncbi:hypothetical protein V5O48_016754, partial [Marasmius crinis-equi]